MINLRHKECFVRASESLKRAQGSIKANMLQDIIAIDLKGAIVALGEVTGENVSDEVIGSIFERFCVGK
jgi:tRNA modification GTPase